MSSWMIYGAYGYTGRLIAERAIARGHAPVLAGRNAAKLREVAEALSLPHRVVGLSDRAGLEAALADVDLVVHAAGPFVHTAEPMMDACLATRTHYTDITGEIPVFQQCFARDERARGAGIVVMSGIAFDVVPTDCLAVYVAGKLEQATELEIAFASGGRASGGTTRTAIEGFRGGSAVRRGGRLYATRPGRGGRMQRFRDRERFIVPIPWGDLVTAWHSTGIENITVSMSMSPRTARAVRLLSPFRALMGSATVRGWVQRRAAERVRNPTPTERAKWRSQFWARATGPSGSAEAWMTTVEGYTLTSISTVLCAERILAEQPSGARSPAQAFGPDLILEVDGTERVDQIPS